jgi:hypothetical protein
MYTNVQFCPPLTCFCSLRAVLFRPSYFETLGRTQVCRDGSGSALGPKLPTHYAELLSGRQIEEAHSTPKAALIGDLLETTQRTRHKNAVKVVLQYAFKFEYDKNG